METISNKVREIAREAGLRSFLKDLVGKIPGFPSKDEALKTVKEFKKDKNKFKKIVDTLGKEIPETEGKVAFDIKNTIKNMRGLADPKIIMAIIVLMGVFGTTDAQILSKSVDKAQVQEQVGKSHIIFVKKFSLAGHVRTDIQVVDVSTGVHIDSKGFSNDEAGSKKFLEEMKKKYPNSRVVEK